LDKTSKRGNKQESKKTKKKNEKSKTRPVESKQIVMKRNEGKENPEKEFGYFLRKIGAKHFMP